MLKPSRHDLKTSGYVLKRTNYGEADRILNIITPEGKISAIAKAVRREKSKLAGGVEMFSLSDYVIHLGKSEFGVVTSAKMVKFYGNIVKNYEKMELAAMILKKISLAAEQVDNPEYFAIIKQCFEALNDSDDYGRIEAWFLMNLAKAKGDEINLHRDTNGEKLLAERRYDWDRYESAFFEREGGTYGADEIKLLRLMLVTKYSTIQKIKTSEDVIKKVLLMSRIFNKM